MKTRPTPLQYKLYELMEIDSWFNTPYEQSIEYALSWKISLPCIDIDRKFRNGVVFNHGFAKDEKWYNYYFNNKEKI